MAAPVLNSVTPSSGSTSGGTAVTLAGSGFTSVVSVKFGTAAASSYTVVSSTQINAVTPAGTGTVIVVVSTLGGSSSQTVTFTYVTAPTLSSVVPAKGPLSGGNTVTLSGSNLTGVVSVKFGTAAASSFTVVSSTEITATAPLALAAGPVLVTVASAGGTSGGVTYTYVAAPTITGIAPDHGPLSGGTAVVLTGSDLTDTGAVSFGTTPAGSFSVASASQINASTPASAAGPAAVTVTTPGGTSSGSSYFYYVPAPTLASVVPDQGPELGGAAVTLTGTNLYQVTSLKFGAIAASSYTVVSATQITAVAPAGTGTVQVTVATAGGIGAGPFYTYVPVPALSSVTPGQGPLYGGTNVTLAGTHLTLTGTVVFGTTPASFAVLSDSTVTADAPAGSAGPVTVTVVTPGGTSNAISFSRLAPP